MNITTFAALADPMRLSLIEALREREQSVNELVERVHIQQSGVSRHLGILARAGLVSARPEGQLRASWGARFDRFGAELARRQASVKKKNRRSR